LLGGFIHAKTQNLVALKITVGLGFSFLGFFFLSILKEAWKNGVIKIQSTRIKRQASPILFLLGMTLESIIMFTTFSIPLFIVLDYFKAVQ